MVYIDAAMMRIDICTTKSQGRQSKSAIQPILKLPLIGYARLATISVAWWRLNNILAAQLYRSARLVMHAEFMAATAR